MATTGPTAAGTQGGNHEPHVHGDGHGRTATRVEAPRLLGRVHLKVYGDPHLEDLAPATARLFEASKRSQSGGGRAHLRRDPARVVSAGAGEALRRAQRKVEAGRRTRLAPGTCPRLAGWLHRTARVHAHLCAIVRLYGRPDRAGGTSLQGETYAARAARGDRTLLYEALTLSIDELVEIRREVDQVMEQAPPTPHGPGTPGKVDEMARRVERGEALFIDGDGSQPGEGPTG